MKFEEFFLSKNAFCDGWVKFITAALRNAPIIKTLDKNVHHFQENNQTSHKVRGGGAFSENTRIEAQVSF